jgi:hypothetical protein
MLTNAAREDGNPHAPRSCSGVARAGSRWRASIAVCSLVTIASCGSEGVTTPSPSTYVAELSGANERPPRQTTGTGRATFVVERGVATYEVTVSALSGAATVAHVIIGGAQTVAGQVVASLPLMASTGTITTGTIDLGRPVTYNNSTISGDSLRSLFELGAAYVNIYTTAYPGGEVRGQIVRRSP